jgi:hypothetical protein
MKAALGVINAMYKGEARGVTTPNPDHQPHGLS